MRDWKDRLGIFASVACAIHCAATPVLVATLPTLKFTEWMIDPKFHQIIAVVCSALVAVAIWPAFARFRDYRVLTLSSAGLGLILSAAFLVPNTCCVHPEIAQVDTAHTGASHAGHDHEDHSHASHSHSAHSHAGQEVAESDSEGTSQLALAGLGAIQPWMTPLGGLLLILAHGLNLRRQLCCSEPRCGVGKAVQTERDLLSIQSDLGELPQSYARAS